MSGAEVAGLVLGVLPLLVSTIEHYETIIESVSKYRKFSSKIRNLHDTLNLERTIFRTECVLLLATDISKNEAESMLKRPSHPKWRDETFDRRMAQCFGSLGNAVNEIVGNMVKALVGITSKMNELSRHVDDASTNTEQSNTRWPSGVKTKLKFALSSQTSISKDLESLTRMNDRFGVLSSQIRQLENVYSTPDYAAQSHSLLGDNLPDFARTRLASLDLYTAFASSCAANHEHFLRLGLNGISTHKDRMLGVNFKFDVQYCTAWLFTPSSQKFSEPTEVNPDHRLLIETSTDFGSTVPQNSTNRETSTASSLSAKALRQQLIQVPNEQTVAKTQDRDLCHRLFKPQPSADSSNVSRDMPVLHGQGLYKHTVVSSQSSIWSHSTTSLAHALCQTKQQGGKAEMAHSQRLSLAETLGIKVLQLHSTPWLARTLHSQELYFIKDPENAPETSHPTYTIFEPDTLYMDVELESKPTTVLRQIPNRNEDSVILPQESRFGLRTGPVNGWLYNLGILLIELAYHTPFSNLVSEMKDEYAALSIPLSTNTSTAEYQIACQLAENVGSTLGVSYAGIVRRCLRCDFNVRSSDLEDPKLQRSVYENVVCKLRDLASAFKTLQTASVD